MPADTAKDAAEASEAQVTKPAEGDVTEPTTTTEQASQALPTEKKEEGKDADSGRGFPADTPPSLMTPEQQVAYWRHYSRQHEAGEARLKAQIAEAQKAEAERVRTEEQVQAELLAARLDGAKQRALRAHPQLSEDTFDKLGAPTDDPEVLLTWADSLASLLTQTTSTVKQRNPIDEIVVPGAKASHEGGSGEMSLEQVYKRKREEMRKKK